jgi:hypothetical protein
MEVTGRHGRKRTLNGLKERTRYWQLKEKACDRNLWRTRFGRGYGSVGRQDCEMSPTRVGITGSLLTMGSALNT